MEPNKVFVNGVEGLKHKRKPLFVPRVYVRAILAQCFAKMMLLISPGPLGSSAMDLIEWCVVVELATRENGNGGERMWRYRGRSRGNREDIK